MNERAFECAIFCDQDMHKGLTLQTLTWLEPVRLCSYTAMSLFL